jgi:hypothetical protein
MIILDPAQALALRKSASGSVNVAGRGGTGKSVLANAIASQAARAGRSCLLVGSSRILDRPLGYGLIREIQKVLSDRAQFDHPASSPAVPPPSGRPASVIEARAKSNPAAARAAVRILEKARELAKSHDLSPSEIESSVVAERALGAGAFESLSLVSQDASRIADALWTGNARAGRTFKDVEELAAGRTVEVPPNDEALGLILADDREYDAGISKIVSDRQDAKEDSLVSHAVASLLRTRSSDRTLSDYHKHASFMAHTIGGAIALIRKHGTFKSALAAGNGNEAAKAIEYFMRMRPDQGIVAAVRTFEAALQDYRHDSAVLEPLLSQYGSRLLGSFAAPAAERQAPLQQDQDVGALVQKLREARYAARHLHGHLGALRASLPKSLFERIVNAPIEDAPEILGSSSGTDPRSMAASELRQLRDLFASTGFGDLFKAPEDLARQIEASSKDGADAPASPAGQSYSPQILDLMLELSTVSEFPAQAEWPSAVKRTRTVQEALDAVAGNSFDVVVIDDASGFSVDELGRIGASAATVHRLGAAEHDDAILLEIPHRQADADVSAVASGQPGRWLGAPDSFGLLIREDPAMSPEQLSAAAGLLVSELIQRGCSASLAAGAQTADVIVAAMDELHEGSLADVAQKAAHGIVILCRKDQRSPPARSGLHAVADVRTALSLGWKIQRATTEGTVLEKGGKLAALVSETAAISPWDETVTDVWRRLESLGWQPIVAWNGAERSEPDLDRLLTAHSMPSTPSQFRKAAEEFDLRAPPPQGGGPGPGSGVRSETKTGNVENGGSPHPAGDMTLAAETVTAGIPEPETAPEAAAEEARVQDEDISPPVAPSSEPEAAAAQPPDDLSAPNDDTLQMPPEDAGSAAPQNADGSSSERPGPVDGWSENPIQPSEPAADDEPADEGRSDTTAETMERESAVAATSMPQAVFRDRRGARRSIAQQDEAEPRRERRTSSRLRQADAKLRLMIDTIRKRISLAAVLLKPEGFPDEIDIGEAAVQTFDESRYDDFDLEWTTGLLDGEIRLKDETQKLEWIRSARPFHLFTAASGEPDLVSTSAAPLGSRSTIVCRERHAAAIEATATEAGSPALRRLEGFEGLPSGWTVLDGYTPVRALHSPPEWLKPLDPGAETVITLHGGLEIRSAAYAQGEPPLIRIEAMPSNCRVFIDEAPAERDEEGNWSAPGWDAPGQHLVDIVPGRSSTYHIMPDPALCNGWEPWTAHASLAPPLAGTAAVCGAMVFSLDGRTVLATEPASSVTALGARHEIKMLTIRQDAPAALAALAFEPLFVVLSSGGRRDDSKILVLDFPTATADQQPRKLDSRWASKIRDMAARRVPIRPETPAAKAAWRSATREARRWKRPR